jgi:hypothetical protein
VGTFFAALTGAFFAAFGNLLAVFLLAVFWQQVAGAELVIGPPAALLLLFLLNQAGVFQSPRHRAPRLVSAAFAAGTLRVPTLLRAVAAAEFHAQLFQRLLASPYHVEPVQRWIATELLAEHVVDDVVVGEIHEQAVRVALPPVRVERQMHQLVGQHKRRLAQRNQREHVRLNQEQAGRRDRRDGNLPRRFDPHQPGQAG